MRDQWPGGDQWLFAVKTFAASMLAVYVAFSIGLQRPYWAMATVYIVAQPLSGAMRSRAVYRLLGTLIGAGITVVLVPNLVNAPELLSAAMALWVGGCLYISLLDRSPRSYVFLLAGYTAVLIAATAVETPGRIWNIALARAEEIGLGVICATVISSVVFPSPLGPVLSARIRHWVDVAGGCTEAALAGRVGPDEIAGRNALAADAVELRMLVTLLAYDTSKWQTATHWVAELTRRMVLMLPLLSSIGDRVAALRAADGITPALAELLATMQVWVRLRDPPPPRAEADQLRGAIARVEEAIDPRRDWNEVMLSSMLPRLRELVDLRQDMRDIYLHMEAGGGHLATPLAFHADVPELLHHDQGMALLSATAAVLTTLLLCAAWIGAAWPAGGTAATLGAVACCLFATLDDPTPALRRFLYIAVVVVVFVGIGLFGVLPRATSFEMLILALGAYFVPVGVLMAMPGTRQIGTVLGFLTATLLSLESTYAADFASYANGAIAALLGLAAAAVMTALVRSVGAEWSARRLLRAVWRDLAAIPNSRTPRDRATMAGLLLDRLGLLVPRLAEAGHGSDLVAADTLADLRVGLNMAGLQRDHETLPRSLRAAVDAVLYHTASHFAAQAAQRHTRTPPPTLLGEIDHALDAAVVLPGSATRDLLLQLVGIRLGLFAVAPPYHPPWPPDADLVTGQAV